MRIKIHEFEYFDRTHPYNDKGCRFTPKVLDVHEMDVKTIPRKGEFIQHNYVIFQVDSVLYSFDTKEIVVSVSPIKRPVKQPVTES